MFKLIGIIVAVAPIVLFLRAVFKGQLKKRSQSLSQFKKQMDYLVWVILFFIGCGVVYAIGKLIYHFLT
jgi:threonine/homoserine/homoserine lactone efflux protein